MNASTLIILYTTKASSSNCLEITVTVAGIVSDIENPPRVVFSRYFVRAKYKFLVFV